MTELGDRELSGSINSTGSREGSKAFNDDTARESLFGEEEAMAQAANGESGGVPYKDDFDVSRLGWVQTPTYYEDCMELDTLGDPCGHRNMLYYDAVQCGLDGYGSSMLLSTNALIRRSAIDSVGGMQYGSFTEGQITGLRMHKAGWDSAYFRKDWEGEVHERFRLITGVIPESVAATMKQRQRIAQGFGEITLGVTLTHGLIDDVWWPEYQKERPPATPTTSRPWPVVIMRCIFFFNEFYEPLSSCIWILYEIIVCWMLFAGHLPMFLNSDMFIGAYMPYIIMCGLINRAATRPVASMDSVKGAETCYSFAFAKLAGFLSAFWVRITCYQKDKKRWGTQAAVKRRKSILQVPNVMCFCTLLAGVIYALYLFFTEEFNTPWEIMPIIVLGMYLIGSLMPVVRMTVQEWLGWSLDSLHDKGHMSSAIVLAILAAWASLWKFVYVADQGSIMF